MGDGEGVGEGGGDMDMSINDVSLNDGMAALRDHSPSLHEPSQDENNEVRFDQLGRIERGVRRRIPDTQPIASHTSLCSMTGFRV